jgi:hypothetical protein
LALGGLQPTGEDGDDGLMYSLDLLLLQRVAGEEGNYEEYDGNEERP